MTPPIVDEIGPWTEVKLEILQRYAVEYSKILASQTSPPLWHVYVDAFAGTGVHLSRTSGEMVLGSPLNALSVNPPFKEYHLIDLDGDKIINLRRLIGDRKDVHLYHGDCNKVLLDEVFPKVQFPDFRRGLCLLDPYKLTLNWKVISEAGLMQSLDVFINFPIHDINRTVLHHDPESPSQANIERMNAFWGDESWKGVAYEKNRLCSARLTWIRFRTLCLQKRSESD